jgi:hypothetical protein
MSKKVWTDNPYEKQRGANAFLRKKWSEFEQSSEIGRRRSVLGNRDLDPEERRKRLSYWFYTWLIGFMFMASIFGIVMSLVGFAFRSPIFYTSIGVLILAIFLSRTKRHGVRMSVRLGNIPIHKRSRREQQRRREKKIEKENEGEIAEFLEGEK